MKYENITEAYVEGILSLYYTFSIYYILNGLAVMFDTYIMYLI